VTIAGLDPGVWFTLGYALFLLGVAVALEAVARHSHRRAHAYTTLGFRYHRETDHWECPTGQRLARNEADPVRRVIYYRAPAHACNSCQLKSGCTDSDEGRTVERPEEQWLESALGRFHRGLSLVLLSLAAIMLVAEMAGHHSPREMCVLGGSLVLLGAVGSKLLSEFRSYQPIAAGGGRSSSLHSVLDDA
jgi:hypothetical protein